MYYAISSVLRLYVEYWKTKHNRAESGSAGDHFSSEICPILQTFPQKSKCIWRS